MPTRMLPLHRAPILFTLISLMLTLALQSASARTEQNRPDRKTTIIGQVENSDGSPIADAVIVSSAGGEAVSAADGSFVLEILLTSDSHAGSVGITAVSSTNGATLIGSRTLPAFNHTSQRCVDLGRMVLSPDTDCIPQWIPEFGFQPGVLGEVWDSAVFDDGTGPALFICGETGFAGGTAVNSIAKWNGEHWSALGEGLNGDAWDMLVFDDGSGPKLFVCGEFVGAGQTSGRRIAAWDGTSWTSLGEGANEDVHCLCIFDNGTGPALHACGQFSNIGGVNAEAVARWDGTSWHALGEGLDSIAVVMHTHDDGSGPALYVGGYFEHSGDLEVNHIARWDGNEWSNLGLGTNDTVMAISEFDDNSGNGPVLVIGGEFDEVGGVPANHIAQWDGSEWSTLGPGTDGPVQHLSVNDIPKGSTPKLFVGGDFVLAGGFLSNGLSRWDGTNWSSPYIGWENFRLHTITYFDDGSGDGPIHFLAGRFNSIAGILIPNIVKWDGTEWTMLGDGMTHNVFAVATFDDGSGAGPQLYAGGTFQDAQGSPLMYVGKWNGSNWEPLDDGMDNLVNDMLVFDDGSGTALYVAGEFHQAGQVNARRIARWDGTEWSRLAVGLSDHAYALEVFDDGSGNGPQLHVGGKFTFAGGQIAKRIARWDGNAWHGLGIGLTSFVRALKTFDDGSGDALYVAGPFGQAGGIDAHGIARWDGTEWSAVNGGPEGGDIYDMEVFDDGLGEGPQLYVAGAFQSVGGVPADSFARWNGTTWSAPSTGGPNDRIHDLHVFDDGRDKRPSLYAGGEFTEIAGVAVNHIAKWDGTDWSALDEGASDIVRCMTSIADLDGNGPALVVGGLFHDSGARDGYIARWQGCPPAPECDMGDINCDDIVDVNDLLLVLSAWGTCTSEVCKPDLNEDGTVDVADLLLLLANWG